MIVLETEMTKTLGEGFEPRALGLLIERVVGIRPVDDLAEQHERCVAGEIIFPQDRLE